MAVECPVAVDAFVVADGFEIRNHGFDFCLGDFACGKASGLDLEKGADGVDFFQFTWAEREEDGSAISAEFEEA